ACPNFLAAIGIAIKPARAGPAGQGRVLSGIIQCKRGKQEEEKAAGGLRAGLSGAAWRNAPSSGWRREAPVRVGTPYARRSLAMLVVGRQVDADGYKRPPHR